MASVTGGLSSSDTGFSLVLRVWTRDNEHKLKHRRFLLNIRKYFLYSENDQALSQVVQGDCEVFILGDIQSHPDTVLGSWL